MHCGDLSMQASHGFSHGADPTLAPSPPPYHVLVYFPEIGNGMHFNLSLNPHADLAAKSVDNSGFQANLTCCPSVESSVCPYLRPYIRKNQPSSGARKN